MTAPMGPGEHPEAPQERPPVPAGPAGPPPHAGLFSEEPVAVFLAGLAGLIDAYLALADALDFVHLTAAQTGALIAFVTTATALAGATLRARVYSPATVARLTQET